MKSLFSSRHSNQLAYCLLGVIIAAGLAVRLHGVYYNLDGDEVFSVLLAGRPIAQVIAQSLKDATWPPLYNIFLHFWILAFGASEISVRALSILFSGAFLILSFMLLKRLVSIWIALGLTGIFALSPLFVYYGQQARPYALIELLSAASLFAFWQVIEAPEHRRTLLLWAITCTLLLYTQYLGILIIAIELCFALVVCPRPTRRSILVYSIASSLLILPWLIFAMGPQLMHIADPIPQINWMTKPRFADFTWFYVSVFGKCPWLHSRWLFLVFLVLAIAYIRHLINTKNLLSYHAFILLIGLGLPTAVYLLSIWGPKPIFTSKQLLGAGIGFVVLIGLSVETLPKILAVPVLLALLLWTATGLPGAFPEIRKPPWHAVATFIDQHYHSIPVLAEENWIRRPLAYYRKKGPVELWKPSGSERFGHDILFICRPEKCFMQNDADFKSHSILLTTWRWGNRDFDKLSLFEIRADDHLTNRHFSPLGASP